MALKYGMSSAALSHSDRAPVTLSIVSHGHGAMLPQLLSDIEEGIDVPYRIILTFNTPEDEGFLAGFAHMPLHVLRNQTPCGFGQNHNRAFLHCTDTVFVIVNPDIRARPFALENLIGALKESKVGAAGPRICSHAGVTQDSARHFPTLPLLLARKFGKKALDYDPLQGSQAVDWLAGMLIAFDSAAYRAVGGFDERYFMYVEDVDIAWRLGQAGYRSIWVPEAQFIHEAQYGSRKNGRHLYWHLRSMLRFLLRRTRAG